METIGDIFKTYLVAHAQGLDTSLSVSEIMRQMKAKDPQGFSRVLRQTLMNLGQDAEAAQFSRAAYIRACLLRDGIEVEWALTPALLQPHLTFDAFTGIPGYDSVAEARAAARDWALGVGPSMLVLVGAVGVGKTHLAQAAAHLATSGPQERRLVYREEHSLKGEIMVAIRKPGNDQPAEVLLDELCTVPWLVLDDLGVVAKSDWWDEMVDLLVNSRWLDPACRTLITTNLTAEQMPARMRSRLRDSDRCRSVVIKAPDYRQHRGRP